MVVDLAVEELEADGDAVILGDFLDAVEAGDGVFGALLVGHSTAVAGKSDDVGDAGLGGKGNIFAKAFFNSGVILDTVHGAGDFATAGISHAADETVVRGHLKFVRTQQVHSS